jgi:hypothetical protein
MFITVSGARYRLRGDVYVATAGSSSSVQIPVSRIEEIRSGRSTIVSIGDEEAIVTQDELPF